MPNKIASIKLAEKFAAKCIISAAAKVSTRADIENLSLLTILEKQKKNR